ncbi:unnamed protein product [Staurois parvus]|uniref:Uncharacterized protein n=1 Tax=Staurois parvus TaxID=386267 RepID=A0ABN9C7P6_9NEOB|nr:unnamed protein product [Staurois parvus]
MCLLGSNVVGSILYRPVLEIRVHAAAYTPRNSAMGPCNRLLMLLPGSPRVVSWVPVTASIAAVSIATLCRCATFRSPHTACECSIFVIGCWQNRAYHCCCPGL